MFSSLSFPAPSSPPLFVSRSLSVCFRCHINWVFNCRHSNSTALSANELCG
jgi:hypothetical protein